MQRAEQFFRKALGLKSVEVESIDRKKEYKKRRRQIIELLYEINERKFNGKGYMHNQYTDGIYDEWALRFPMPFRRDALTPEIVVKIYSERDMVSIERESGRRTVYMEAKDFPDFLASVKAEILRHLN